MTHASILLLAGLASGAAASPCLERPIRLAYYESGLFYAQGKGVDVDVVAELKRRSSCRIEAMVVPRARAYALLEAGQMDIVMASVENPARSLYAFFSPYLQQRFITVVSRTVPAAQTTLEGFTAAPALHFGMLRSVSYGEPRDAWTRRMMAQGRMQIAPTPAIAYGMLQAGRFSALFAIPLQYEKELADRGMRDQVTLVDWFPQSPPTARNLALSRKTFSAEQLKAWDALVRTMRGDGAMLTILQRYLTPAEAAKAVPK